MIQERQETIQEVKHLLELSKKDADREIADSVKVFERSLAELNESIMHKHILRGALRRERVFQDRYDPCAFSD